MDELILLYYSIVGNIMRTCMKEDNVPVQKHYIREIIQGRSLFVMDVIFFVI